MGLGLGLFRAGSHDVVDIPGCPVQMRGINETVESVRAALAESEVSLYDEVKHSGHLRYITVREGAGTGEILVGLVTRSPAFPSGDELARNLLSQVRGVVGVVQNINPHKGNVIFGRSSRILSGRDYMEEVVCGIRIRLGITSFFQVNTAVAGIAYETILRHVLPTAPWTEPTPPNDSTLLDLYSGVGSIGLTAAAHVEDVWGIEEVGESVELARSASHANNLDNAHFRQGLVEEVLPELSANLRRRRGANHRIVVVVNPPRKGVEPKVVELLLEARPLRIAYLSCEPRTLFRDLARFEAGRYEVKHIEAFDMFPQAEQVETLAVLAPP